MTTWLIIGGAGYIGSHVARHMFSNGLPVHVVDSLSSGLRSRLPVGIPLHQLDVRRTEEFRDLLAEVRPSGLVYLAGLKQARESTDIPIDYWSVNMGGLVSTVEALQGSSVKHLIFSSSCSIFGNSSAAREDSTVDPGSVYARTKYASELLLRDCMPSMGISHAVLRYFNVVGNGKFLDSYDRADESVVPRMANLVQRNLPVEIYGNTLPTPDGTCLRDYIDVRDIAQAHVSVADLLECSNPSVAGFEFNLGSDGPVSVLDITREICKAFGREPEIVYRERNLADPVAVWSDSEKARLVLNWAPQYSLEESIRSHVVHLSRP